AWEDFIDDAVAKPLGTGLDGWFWGGEVGGAEGEISGEEECEEEQDCIATQGALLPARPGPLCFRTCVKTGFEWIARVHVVTRVEVGCRVSGALPARKPAIGWLINSLACAGRARSDLCCRSEGWRLG